MLRMQVYLPEELFSDLKQHAAVKDVSMSEIIRKGLRKVLPNRSKSKNPMNQFVGQYQSKRKTNSVKEINNYYQNQ